MDRGLSRSALENRNIRYFTVDTALQGLVQAGLTAFIAVFLVRLGAPNAVVGLASAAPSLGSIFLSVPMAARLEGRQDLVRIVVIWRLFARLTYLGVALVPFWFPGSQGIWPVVLLWALSSVPAAVINPAWTAVVAAIVPPSRRPTVNGNRWSLLSIVMAVGGAGFGQLLDRIVFPLDFQVVFFLSFLAGMATLYTFSRIRMPEPDRAGVPAESGPPPREAFRWSGAVALVRASPLFTRFVVSSFVYRIGLNLPVALYSIYWVRDVQASNAVIGLRSSAASLVLIVSYLAWGRLAGRRGHRVVLLAASAGCSLYPLATALVSPGHAIWLIPVALIWGTFASGIDVSFFEALLHTCPRDRLQTFVGINSALANLVIFVAPIAGTLLGDLIGVRQALIAAAAFSLLGTALFYILAIAKEEVPAAVRVTGSVPGG